MISRERELALPHGTLAAREWGEPGQRRVLALHGWLDNAASFDALAPLIERVHLVALDLPGHGRSSHRPCGNWYHFVDYLSDVAAALDALGWDRCTLLGHSLGGAVASCYAGAEPARVDALWLIEALGPMSSKPERTRELVAQALADRRTLEEKSLRVFAHVDEAVAARVRGQLPISELAARRIVERGLQRVEGGWTWSSDPRLTLTSALRMTEPQIESLIAGIACPTLLVMAAPLEPFLDAAAIERRTRLVPDLTRCTLAGSHHLHIETPEPVAAAIRAFRAMLRERQHVGA